MADVSAPTQSTDPFDNGIPLNFFDNKIDKGLYFQLSNFLLQSNTIVCDKLSIPQPIKYYAKKAFTRYLLSKEECSPHIYDCLILASLTFTLKSYSHFPEIIQIIWEGVKEKEDWAHITQAQVQDFEEELRNLLPPQELMSPYDLVPTLIQYLSLANNHERLLLSCIDLAITIPQSLFYDSATICFSSLNMVFELLQLNFEEKSALFQTWPQYKENQVQNFFKILKQKYYLLIEKPIIEEN